MISDCLTLAGCEVQGTIRQEMHILRQLRTSPDSHKETKTSGPPHKLPPLELGPTLHMRTQLANSLVSASPGAEKTTQPCWVWISELQNSRILNDNVLGGDIRGLDCGNRYVC